jgi:O-antigen biosynthesis protein
LLIYLYLYDMLDSHPIMVSVVIVSYNVRDFVLDAIQSVHSFLKFPTQIILVDNNSSDYTVEKVRANFPEVEIIVNTDNKGFSAANNQAFERCKGSYIIMLNPDAAFIDDSINLMIEELAKTADENVLIGPRIFYPDGSFQDSCWKYPSFFHHLMELFFLNSLFDSTSYKASNWNQKTEVDFLSGACIAFSKQTLNKLDGLDVNLFWMDDVDFCKRNIKAGGVNYYYPGSKIRHYIGQSSKKNQRVVISNQIISKLKFYRKHKQNANFVFSVPIFLLQILTRIPLFLILGIAKPFYLKKASAYVYTLNRLFEYLFSNKQSVM